MTDRVMVAGALWCVVLYTVLVFPVPWLLLRRWRWGERCAVGWVVAVWVTATHLWTSGQLKWFGWIGTRVLALLSAGGLVALVLLAWRRVRMLNR